MEIAEVEEVFEIFDSIKSQFHLMIIKGIDTGTDSLNKLQTLREKVKKMQLDAMTHVLDSIITNLEKMTKGINTEKKHTLSQEILNIITLNRIFERVMTIDILKAKYNISTE